MSCDFCPPSLHQISLPLSVLCNHFSHFSWRYESVKKIRRIISVVKFVFKYSKRSRCEKILKVRYLKNGGILKRKCPYTLLTIITVQKNTLFINLVNREFKTEKVRLSKTEKHILNSSFSVLYSALIRVMKRVFVCTIHTVHSC